jgi:hypothetical protein
MNMITLPDTIHACLQNEMQIKMRHFYSTYNSFEDDFKVKANGMMLEMFSYANSPNGFNCKYHNYLDGSLEQNQFIQSMSECFEALNKYADKELIIELFTHGSRGGKNWFPIVVITEPIDDYSNQPSQLFLYRGCDIEEFNTNRYWQSWTTELDTAKCFAFTHFNNQDLSNRVIVKAQVKSSDIVLMRASENEVVLRLDFAPISHEIVMNYNDFQKGKSA